MAFAPLVFGLLVTVVAVLVVLQLLGIITWPARYFRRKR
jgi:hypothetical protein